MYNGLQAFAENIDAWRTNLVTRIKLHGSTSSDLQSSTNAATYACDLNARTNSNISGRLDQLAKRFNQLDQRTSINHDDIRSLRSSLDQFRSASKTRFLLLRDQLQALSESPNIECLSSPPLPSIEVVDTEHTVVIEGLCEKVKGLEQTLVTERNAVKGLRDMVVGLSER